MENAVQIPSEPVQQSSARRWVLFLVVMAFMLGPALGLIYFWNDMHNRIRTDSEPYARESMESYLSSWDVAALMIQADPSLTRDKAGDNPPDTTLGGIEMEAATAKWSSQLGPLKEITSMKPINSWAKNREEKDQVWQHVVWEAEATFDKGSATITWGIARPFIYKDWKVESVEVTPVTSGA